MRAAPSRNALPLLLCAALSSAAAPSRNALPLLLCAALSSAAATSNDTATAERISRAARVATQEGSTAAATMAQSGATAVLKSTGHNGTQVLHPIKKLVQRITAFYRTDVNAASNETWLVLWLT